MNTVTLAGAGFASITIGHSVHRMEYLRSRASWLKYEMNRVHHCATREAEELAAHVERMRKSQSKLLGCVAKLQRCLNARGLS